MKKKSILIKILQNAMGKTLQMKKKMMRKLKKLYRDMKKLLEKHIQGRSVENLLELT